MRSRGTLRFSRKQLIEASLSRTTYLLLYHYESPRHFVQHRPELVRQQTLLGINHHVHIARLSNPRQPHRFPQPPLHAIAHHRSAQRASHRESHPRSSVGRALLPAIALAGGLAARLRACARQIENRQGCGKMPPPLLVNPLEIRMAQQSPAAREANLLPPRLGLPIRLFLGSEGAHGDCLIEISCREKLVQKS